MTSYLPAIQSDIGLSQYLEKVRAFPMLTPEEESRYAKDWEEHGDKQAAHKLVTSHLRLVVKLAMGYRGYGLQISELISEGNIGLMQAVKKFDSSKGFRLATYAIWWIKASIQEYILRSWSLVKIGTTAAQKKLFFNLKKLKREINAIDHGDMHPDDVSEIAQHLDVSEKEVVDMNRRLMGHDHSLHTPMHSDEESSEWINVIADEDTDSQETSYANRQELSVQEKLLQQSLSILNEREVDIFKARYLADPPITLSDLSKKHNGISSERVRQIATRAFEKVQKFITEKSAEQNYLPDYS